MKQTVTRALSDLLKKAVKPYHETNPSGTQVWYYTCPDSLGVYLINNFRGLIPPAKVLSLLGMFRYGLENQGQPRTGEGTYEGLFKIEIDGIKFPYRPIQDSLGALLGLARLLGGAVLLNAQPIINQETGEHDNDWEIVYKVILPGGSVRLVRPEWHEIVHPDDRNWYCQQWLPYPDNPF